MGSESDKLVTETSIWLARLERGLQAQEGSLLRAWLKDPARRTAIVDAAKLYHGPDIVAVLAQMVPVGFGNPPPPRSKRVHPVVRILVATALLVFVLIPPVLIHRTMPGVLDSTHYKPLDAPLPWGEEVYTTKPGETRAVNLADGSKLTLNTHTKVGVLFGVGSRLATLEYGEALFNIRPGRERPFEVNAGGRHFQAPASMFDVRIINPQAVELTVLDGGVTVRGLPWHWPDTPAQARVFDPRAFADLNVGPLQAAILEDATISQYSISAAAAHERVRWEPQEVLYVNP